VVDETQDGDPFEADSNGYRVNSELDSDGYRADKPDR